MACLEFRKFRSDTVKFVTVVGVFWISIDARSVWRNVSSGAGVVDPGMFFGVECRVFFFVINGPRGWCAYGTTVACSKLNLFLCDILTRRFSFVFFILKRMRMQILNDQVITLMWCVHLHVGQIRSRF